MHHLSKLPEISRRFQSLFGVSLESYLDNNVSVMFNEVRVDIFKFDDYLHTLDNYEELGLTMDDFIAERYGQSASKFFAEII